ncbi:hypothetical protein Tco_1536235, partial [Tanacetum coccineum]
MLGAVGATLGAIAGVVIGWSHKTRFMQNAVIGAVLGTALAYKLTKATFDHLNSDDDDELGLAHYYRKLNRAPHDSP